MYIIIYNYVACLVSAQMLADQNSWSRDCNGTLCNIISLGTILAIRVLGPAVTITVLRLMAFRFMEEEGYGFQQGVEVIAFLLQYIHMMSHGSETAAVPVRSCLQRSHSRSSLKESCRMTGLNRVDQMRFASTTYYPPPRAPPR